MQRPPHPSLPPSLQPLRLLGIFAHPDDEVFCMGGTLAQWSEAGSETMIISATHGEAGQIQDARAASRGTLGAVRERELRAACARLGVQRVACLGYGDGALADVNTELLASHLATYLEDFRPDIVVTFGPDGGSGHPDHIAISRATTAACALVARADGWAPQLYYSAFPQRRALLCQGLAHWLTTHGSAFHGSAACVRALALLADEATLLGHANDAVEVQWFPADFAMVEQGEQGNALYLIISGHAEVIHEQARGTRQLRQRLGPGQFFGAAALVNHRPQEASVVARDTVTCLVLSPQARTAFAGRGEHGHLGGTDGEAADGEGSTQNALIRVDISAYLEHKVAALAAHRTQFAIEPELFSLAPLWQLMAHECFERVPLAISSGTRSVAGTDDVIWLDAPPCLAVSA